MIVGIGTDLCDIRRIQQTLDRKTLRFAEKVLGPNELLVFQQRLAKVPARGVRYLATRFAAKEAFSKAIGLGMRMPMTWALRDPERPQRAPRNPPARRAGRLVRPAPVEGPCDRDRRGRSRAGLRRG